MQNYCSFEILVKLESCFNQCLVKVFTMLNDLKNWSKSCTVQRNTRPVLFANTCYNLLQLLLLTTTAQTTFFTEMLSIKANTFFGQFMLFPFFPFHRVFSYHLAGKRWDVRQFLFRQFIWFCSTIQEWDDFGSCFST